MATPAVKQDACPWCGQRIPHKQFVEIETRIRAEEKRRLEATEREMHARLADERDALETRYRADRMSLELTAQKAKEQLERANERANERVKEHQAEFEKRLKEATEGAAATERKKVEAELARQHIAEREREREVLKADYDQKMLKQHVENQTAAQGLRKQVVELQRRLDEQAARKPEVVDIDVFEQLRTDYPGDRVLRLPRGDAGGDLLVEVKYKGTICGRIVLDSRARGNWQTSYAAKLRTDMVEQRADHAILATVHFPRGASELCRHDDVLLVHPARVSELVGILRQAMVRMFQTRLSVAQRADKKSKLYDHITSELFRRKLDDSGKLTRQLLDLDVEEVKDHTRVWKTRGGILKKLETANSEVVGEINDIVDGLGGDD